MKFTGEQLKSAESLRTGILMVENSYYETFMGTEYTLTFSIARKIRVTIVSTSKGYNVLASETKVFQTFEEALLAVRKTLRMGLRQLVKDGEEARKVLTHIGD